MPLTLPLSGAAPPTPTVALPCLKFAHLSLTPYPLPRPAALVWISPPRVDPLANRTTLLKLHRIDFSRKRTPPWPNPNLYSRTKKKKIAHQYFRSEALLYSPPAKTSDVVSSPAPRLRPMSPPAVAPLFPLSPVGLVAPLPSPISSMLRKYAPDTPRQRPLWWASVSRSLTKGTASKMGPREEEWTGGDALGWRGLLAAVPVVARAKRTWPFRRERDLANESRVKVVATLPVPLDTVDAKSVADPDERALAQLPTKKRLLHVLRLRMHESGGNSREAGALRFTKWVRWNRYFRQGAEDGEPPMLESFPGRMPAPSSTSSEIGLQLDAGSMEPSLAPSVMLQAHTTIISSRFANAPVESTPPRPTTSPTDNLLAAFPPALPLDMRDAGLPVVPRAALSPTSTTASTWGRSLSLATSMASSWGDKTQNRPAVVGGRTPPTAPGSPPSVTLAVRS